MAKAKNKTEEAVETTVKTTEDAVEANSKTTEGTIVEAVEVELSDEYLGHTGIIVDGLVLSFVTNKATIQAGIAEKLRELGIVK